MCVCALPYCVGPLQLCDSHLSSSPQKCSAHSAWRIQWKNNQTRADIACQGLCMRACVHACDKLSERQSMIPCAVTPGVERSKRFVKTFLVQWQRFLVHRQESRAKKCSKTDKVETSGTNTRTHSTQASSQYCLRTNKLWHTPACLQPASANAGTCNCTTCTGWLRVL